MRTEFTRTAVVLFSMCLISNFGEPSDRNSQRESWQPPAKILDAAGVRAGMNVGEAGAGTGYLTFHLAERVGPEGTVYANEIAEDDLESIRSRARREGVANIVTVLGEIEDPLFPVDDLDMVIMVYVLHHLDHPIQFLKNLEKYLKPGTPVVIVEQDFHLDRSHPPEFMSNRQILETIEESGYTLEETESSLPRDTIYIFRVPG